MFGAQIPLFYRTVFMPWIIPAFHPRSKSDVKPALNGPDYKSFQLLRTRQRANHSGTLPLHKMEPPQCANLIEISIFSTLVKVTYHSNIVKSRIILIYLQIPVSWRNLHPCSFCRRLANRSWRWFSCRSLQEWPIGRRRQIPSRSAGSPRPCAQRSPS